VADQPSSLSGILGPLTTNFSSSSNNTALKSDYLIFNSFLPFKLKKITVDAASPGIRIFQLRDMYGKMVAEKQVTLVLGIQDVALDFFVPAAMNLQLGLSSASPLAALNTSTTTATNIGYPFNFKSVGKIVGSSLGDKFYPFCYNWQVEVIPQVCNSGARKAVVATVVPQVAVNIAGLQPTYLHTQNGVPLTLTPAGGILNGPGLIGQTFYPKLAGVGTHTFTYTIKKGNCVSVVSKTVTVDFDNAVMKDGFSIQLFNNPGQIQQLYLVTNQNSAVEVRLLNSVGQLIKKMNFTASTGSNTFNLDFSNLSKSMYILDVRMAINGASKTIKLVN
jgi:hypothetical protein